jgi:hypothetical protein
MLIMAHVTFIAMLQDGRHDYLKTVNNIYRDSAFTDKELLIWRIKTRRIKLTLSLFAFESSHLSSKMAGK